MLKGRSVMFKIFASFGDKILCIFENEGYILTLDGNLVASGCTDRSEELTEVPTSPSSSHCRRCHKENP